MKFKAAIIGLLVSILITCIFTAYKLTAEAEKQTQIQLAQAEGIITIIEMSDKTIWQVDKDGIEPFIVINGEDIKSGVYQLITEVTDRYDKIKNIIENVKNGQND